MPLIKLTTTASYGVWVNTDHILEVAESRDRDFVRMAGTGNSGTYTISVESASAVAKAVKEAEGK